MNRLSLFARGALALGAVALVATVFITLSPSEVSATPTLQPDAAPNAVTSPVHDFTLEVKPCVRKVFKTELIKKACAEGGQKAAKKAMGAFLKAAKKKVAEGEKKPTCKSCHTKLKEDFALTKDGLKLYKKWK